MNESKQNKTKQNAESINRPRWYGGRKEGVRMRMRISRAELKRREDRKSLRHMYVTLKYGDGVCAANSIRQDFQCGHDELI
mmetsp:Transcript_24200/g.36976  ORF Transcript_24200/g.36976 Transcript_24200/m.36976 type:complete len:81 (+) Transcript_24200:332-574(+)